MKVYSDSLSFSKEILPEAGDWTPLEDTEDIEACPKRILFRMSSKGEWHSGRLHWPLCWSCFVIVEKSSFSQYDILIELSRSPARLNDDIICLAGHGRGFHGRKDRPWVTLPGNLHLSLHLAPDAIIENFAGAFMAMTAVSLVQTLDAVEGLKGKAGIKWVNDILIDGAKVAGILTHTQSMDNMVTSAVIGVGINVERIPETGPDRYTGGAASIRSFAPRVNQTLVLKRFLYYMDENYRKVKKGKADVLLEAYRDRSVFLGKEVRVVEDDEDGIGKELARGRLNAVGDNLELYIEGHEKPITSGRLEV